MTDSALLRKLSTAVGVGSKLLPGSAGLVGGIIAEGLALAADLAKAGKDPAVAIRRIRNVDPMLAQIDQKWQAAMAKRFLQIVSRVPEDSQEDIYADVDKLANR